MKKPNLFLKILGLSVGTSMLLTSMPIALAASPLVESTQIQTAKSLQQAEALNNQGVDLAEQGKFAEAVAAFTRAIAIYPDYEHAHNNLGLAFASQEKFAEAVTEFQHALEINPNNLETYNNLGIAFGSQGKFTEAVGAFNQAIKINPNEPTSHQNLGVAFWSQGKLPEAVAFLQKAKELYSMQNNTDGVSHVEQILQQIQRTSQSKPMN